MDGKGLQGAAVRLMLSEGYWGTCPALWVLVRRECSQVWPPHDCKLLILPVELFPDHTLPAGSAPLLSGGTSSA